MKRKKVIKKVSESPISMEEKNYVYVEKAVTKNMGDHSFVKITVGARLHVNHTRKDLDETVVSIEVLSEALDEVMSDELNALEED
jgi:predicted site-specific integrase-resolvase